MSQKTRKKSASKTTKKAAPASRSATKGRAKATVKVARKVAATKSSKNKRSAMPEKTAKTAAKATGSKATASKVVAKTPSAPVKAAPVKAAPPKVAPKAAVAPKPAAKPVAAAPRVEEPKKVVTQRQGFKANEFVVYPAHGVGMITYINGAGSRGPQARTLRHFFRAGQADAARPDRQDDKSVGMRKLAEEDGGQEERWTRRPAAPASSAPCGRAARRNTKPRSTRAI